jgi:hypothetical protein
MNDYETIQYLSKRFTQRERQDLMLDLLKRVQSRLNLSNQDINVIWNKSQQEPGRCTWVREDGAYRGTKCRNPIVSTTKFCKHHKNLES